MEPERDAAIRRAYAALGLKPGSSWAEVRQQYRLLAQRWHPDRHVGDERNRTEAGAEMRRINAAFEVLFDRLAPSASRAVAARPAEQGAESRGGRRLSQVEIDAIVGSIGTRSMLAWVLGREKPEGSARQALAVGLIGTVLFVIVPAVVWAREFGGLGVVWKPLVGILMMVGGRVAYAMWERRRAG